MPNCLPPRQLTVEVDWGRRGEGGREGEAEGGAYWLKEKGREKIFVVSLLI